MMMQKKTLKKFKGSCRGIKVWHQIFGQRMKYYVLLEILERKKGLNMHMQAKAVHGIGGILPLGTHIME